MTVASVSVYYIPKFARACALLIGAHFYKIKHILLSSPAHNKAIKADTKSVPLIFND
jgi:hypothetical protein